MPFIKISQLTTATAVSATNQLEINQNGASRSAEVSVLATYVRSSATNVLVLPAGSTAAPALFPTGDTNTGIFFPAADTIAFSEGGVEVMRIDSDGDVGIGTTTPTARLNVVAATTVDAVRITQTGTGNALVVEDSANPDATPFVVDATGRLIVGSTATQPSLGTSNTPQIGVFGNSASNNGFANYSYTDSTAANFFNFVKSRSVTPGTFSIVLSGDDFGYIKFIGDDGTQFLEAARIYAEVDGTPGVNDMPGRLIFSTTGDGASTPTERMRIGSTGNIGIGTSGTEPFTIRNLRDFSGATTAYGISQGGEIQSGVTGSVFVNHTAPTTQATAFTLGTVYHYSANSLTIGAGSAVTTQYGFFAGSSLTTATNNYGFYSDIASGTNRWNFYANGTAANYFAGQVQLAAGSVSAPALAAFGDTNTGMFFFVADTIAFSEGGTEAMRINSSAQVEFSAGTVSLPSITATGDTNTGIFFPAADTLALGTNGTERLRIASAGQIGIGGANYGTSGQVLTSNGAAAAPSWQDATAGSASQLREQLFLSSGTWTAPAGVTQVRLVVIGGGGGGGGYNSTGGTNDGGNGGSAGVAVGNVTVVPGTAYTVTIGAGGAGGATNTNGTAGSTTSFGALMSATGGGAGLTNGGVGANGAGSSGTTRNTNTSVTTMAPFGGSNSRAAGSGAATVAWANNSANGAGAFGTGGNASQAAAGAVNGIVYVEWVE